MVAVVIGAVIVAEIVVVVVQWVRGDRSESRL